MLTRNHIQPSRRRRGVTMVEVIIASAISLVSMVALVSIYNMASRFSAEGMREAILLNQCSQAIEGMTRRLNAAYRLDAETTAYQFSIQDNYSTIEFSFPDSATGSVLRERYRYDAVNDELLHERRNSGGTFVQVGGRPLLKNVAEFAVDNQEGILSLVIRLEFAHNYYGTKRYTLIGRALPRNI
jgi:Tfp pilus assembly protein PilV